MTQTKARKPDKDGRFRFTFAFTEDVAEALYMLAEADRRSMTEELSFLVMERAGALGLDLTGQLRKEGGD